MRRSVGKVFILLLDGLRKLMINEKRISEIETLVAITGLYNESHCFTIKTVGANDMFACPHSS